MATNVLGKVYETLLCSPGMNEAVKIDVKMNRKAVLLLNSVIEGGLGKEGDGTQEFLKHLSVGYRENLLLLYIAGVCPVFDLKIRLKADSD